MSGILIHDLSFHQFFKILLSLSVFSPLHWCVQLIKKVVNAHTIHMFVFWENSY